MFSKPIGFIYRAISIVYEEMSRAGRPRPYGRTCLFHYDGACKGGSRTAPTNDTTFKFDNN